MSRSSSPTEAATPRRATPFARSAPGSSAAPEPEELAWPRRPGPLAATRFSFCTPIPGWKTDRSTRCGVRSRGDRRRGLLARLRERGTGPALDRGMGKPEVSLAAAPLRRSKASSAAAMPTSVRAGFATWPCATTSISCSGFAARADSRSSRDKTQTSPRRYESRGALAQVLVNWKVLLGYFAGVSPKKWSAGTTASGRRTANSRQLKAASSYEFSVLSIGDSPSAISRQLR